ncbi:7705_t:CDS:2, partial [Acaulospora colombiana]
NFTNAKDAEAGHKTEAVAPEGSKVPKKKLTTSLRELVQKKFVDISKKLKDPDTPPIQPGKNIWIVIRDNWKQFLGIGILTDILFALVVNKISEYRVNSALENGTRLKPKVLKMKHGTGKTTLTRMVATNVGKGVIYVDIPSDFENLGEAFGKAINLSFFEDVSITTLLMREFFSVMVYKKKNHKPPVIIYDNMSRIVKENAKILDILQDDAKDNADDREYIAVFVSSEGSVPRRMESRSAWSRADKPVMKIGDLSEKESMDYLVNKLKINSVEAKKLYELVGGRIVDLKSVADKFLAGQSLEAIKQQILTEVNKKFYYAKLLPDQARHEAGKHVIGALIDSKEIHTSVFRNFIGDEEFGEVLGANVFAYHPSRDTVTFQSQSVEYYIRENASIFGNTQEGKRKM